MSSAALAPRLTLTTSSGSTCARASRRAALSVAPVRELIGFGVLALTVAFSVYELDLISEDRAMISLEPPAAKKLSADAEN